MKKCPLVVLSCTTNRTSKAAVQTHKSCTIFGTTENPMYRKVALAYSYGNRTSIFNNKTKTTRTKKHHVRNKKPDIEKKHISEGQKTKKRKAKDIRTINVGIESALELRERDLSKRGETLDASVIYQHIYPTVLLQDIGQRVLYAILRRNIQFLQEEPGVIL